MPDMPLTGGKPETCWVGPERFALQAEHFRDLSKTLEAQSSADPIQEHELTGGAGGAADLEVMHDDGCG